MRGSGWRVMPRARLHLTVPESVWIGALSRSHPETLFRILAALTDETGSGTGLVELREGDVGAVVDDLLAVDAVDDLTPLHRGEETALVQFETSRPVLLGPVQESGTPLELPFTLRDGRAEWEVTAPRDRLSALASSLDAFGIPYDVEYVRRTGAVERILTDAQHDLLSTAAERGYYDTPRETTLSELASDLGMAKSTVSETLHRAEGKLVERFLDAADRR